MIPLPTTGAELQAVRAAFDALAPLLDAIAARHRLQASPRRSIATGSFPVFFLGDGEDVVIKLVPERWRAKLASEIAALRCFAAAKLPAALPTVVGEGEMDGWHYLAMTRVPGRSLASCAASLSLEQLSAAARDLGALMRAMHAVTPPTSSLPTVDWPAFVLEQSATATSRHADGAPARWLDAIPEFLAREVPCLADHRTAAMSADLHGDHVLLEERNGHIALTGVIDFGDALIGDPDYDFVTPATFIVRGRPALMAALLDGYDLPATARTPDLRARFFAYELLHRFANIARDVSMLVTPRDLPTLADVERALFPFAD